ncbi:MAG: hypothetical protein L6R36_000697 [Xanthoria steineri]|nr:MAG: hypothetical protein L6R36_000697 [Xanthoria steineri]
MISRPSLKCFESIRIYAREFRSSTYHLALRNSLVAGDTEADQVAAREWLKGFGPSNLPKNSCEVSFSRSSGPGGQNVNKVNSKAMLRLPLKDLLPSVPKLLHDHIRASPYYAEKSDALVIQADSNRKQNDNVDACFMKLQHLILAAGRSSIRGETSPEQAERVKRLYECAYRCSNP